VRRAAAVVALILAPALSWAESSEPVNLLSWGAGALMVQKPVSYNEDPGNWSPMALQDESPETGWATANGDLSPKTFVFELAERSEIASLGFNTGLADGPQRAAKNVRVELSDRADGGFAEIAKLQLENKRDGQRFPLKSPVSGRYVRLTALDNWGDDQNIEIMDFAAYGKPLAHTTLPDNSGAFESHYGTFRLKQEGATAAGCYEDSFGLIESGGFEGRVLRFTWREGEPGRFHGGPAIMIFAADGKSFTGFWWNEGEGGVPGIWNGTRISRDVGACPHWKPGGNGISQQLKAEGRVRLYGILFDTDSDHLKDESKTALDQLLAAAKAEPTWKFLIEGHTDNAGGDAHNQPLSEKRAAAVKAYLVAAGVDTGRLATQGFGANKPVAGNDTAVGRAQNRRVEIVKQ
jgi:OOP family OmpA-OmpF porin